MTTLADGRHDIEVPGTDRGDELGHMARAVLVFRDAAVEKERLEAQSADAQKASEVERQRNEAARAAAAAQVKHVVDALGEGLEQLAKGALTYRITDGFADEYKKVQRRLQRGHRAVAGDDRRDRDVDPRGVERRR